MDNVFFPGDLASPVCTEPGHLVHIPSTAKEPGGMWLVCSFCGYWKRLTDDTCMDTIDMDELNTVERDHTYNALSVNR